MYGKRNPFAWLPGTGSWGTGTNGSRDDALRSVVRRLGRKLTSGALRKALLPMSGEGID